VVLFRPHLQQLLAAVIAYVCLHLWRWARGLEVLHRVERSDWDSIEPSMLGTLFERSLDPSKRAQLGAHYTSKVDILAVVEPVLMAPLRRKWAEVREQAEKLVERRDTASGGRATRINNDLSRLLSRFAEEIAGVRVLDPACGSGNFLSVSMQSLLNLVKEGIAFARDVGLFGFFPSVGPEQVHGIQRLCTYRWFVGVGYVS
jgi:hypothetical protein